MHSRVLGCNVAYRKMIKYSKIRWWFFGIELFLILWGSVNYLRGGNAAVPTVLFFLTLAILFVATLLEKVDYGKE